MAETDLNLLLSTMQPVLWPDPWGIVQRAADAAEAQGVIAFAVIREAEGTTLVAPTAQLRAAGLACEADWARISLTVHSDLAAVGLTAAFAGALAEVGISANVIAGYSHDHILVPWDRRHDALEALLTLSRGAAGG